MQAQKHQEIFLRSISSRRLLGLFSHNLLPKAIERPFIFLFGGK